MALTFIAGHALDSVDNTPLPGATVTEVSNPSNTTAADQEGAFSISVQDPNTQLIVSFTGYQSLQDKAINLRGDDWLVSNDKAYASLYQAVKRAGSSAPGVAITVILIVLFMKLFKTI